MVVEREIGTKSLILRPPSAAQERLWESIGRIRDSEKHIGLPSIADELKRWDERGYGMFLIMRRLDACFAGAVGLARPYRCEGPHLVCAVLSEYRGRGVATEACRGVLTWWFANHDGSPFAHVKHGNSAGQALAKALGGVRVEPREGYFADTEVDYAITRESFRAVAATQLRD